jgi:hypothetical protein
MLFNDLAKTRVAQIAQQRRMEDIASGPGGPAVPAAKRAQHGPLPPTNCEG